MLEALRARGLKLGIVTNASQTMAMRDAELRTLGLIEYFPDCRIAAADVGYLKPHRRIFQAALERIGANAAETVFIGDNPIADIAGAEAAGMRAAQRVNGSAAAADGGLWQRQSCLRSLTELPAILDAWYPGW